MGRTVFGDGLRDDRDKEEGGRDKSDRGWSSNWRTACLPSRGESGDEERDVRGHDVGLNCDSREDHDEDAKEAGAVDAEIVRIETKSRATQDDCQSTA